MFTLTLYTTHVTDIWHSDQSVYHVTPSSRQQMTPFTSSDNEISSYKFMLCKQFVKGFPYMKTADYFLMLSSISKRLFIITRDLLRD